MLGKLVKEFLLLEEMELSEIKSRRNHTTHECPFLVHRQSKNHTFGHFKLQQVGLGIGSQPNSFVGSIWIDAMHCKGISSVKIPYFVGLELVEPRWISIFQKEVNVSIERHVQAGAGLDDLVGPASFSVVPALGVGLQLEAFDPFLQHDVDLSVDKSLEISIEDRESKSIDRKRVGYVICRTIYL